MVQKRLSFLAVTFLYHRNVIFLFFFSFLCRHKYLFFALIHFGIPVKWPKYVFFSPNYVIGTSTFWYLWLKRICVPQSRYCGIWNVIVGFTFWYLTYYIWSFFFSIFFVKIYICQIPKCKSHNYVIEWNVMGEFQWPH